jgi:hypothetical protein
MSCCESLAAEIAALRGELARIRSEIRGLEERAAAKGAQKAEASLAPRIAKALAEALGAKSIAQGAVFTAGGALAQAGTAAALASAAMGVARGAMAAMGGITSALNGIRAMIAAAIARAGAALGVATAAQGAAAAAGTAAAAAAAAIAGVLAAIAGILASLGAIKVLGARIDGLESGQLQLSRDIGRIWGYLTSLKNQNATDDRALAAARAAQATADRAQGTALNAWGAALTANFTADKANTTANKANTTAQDALGAAGDAQKTATTATTTANTANNTANKANNTANGALATAIAAQATANQALNNPNSRPIYNITYPIREVIRQVQTKTIQHTREIIREVQTNTVTRTIQTRVLQEVKEVPINFAPFANALQDVAATSRQNLVINQSIQGAVKTIPDQLRGIQNSVGGIAVSLNNFWKNTQSNFKKLSKRLMLPEILDALTLVVVIHNGMMLSRSLGLTLGELASQALAVIGLKDEDGKAYDVNAIIGGSVENFLKSIMGAQNYENTSEVLKKANTVIAAGSMTIWTVRSIFDAGRDLWEMTANNVGHIGNGLKRDGVVSPSAYPPMSTNSSQVSRMRSRLENVNAAIGNAEDAASSFGVVTSSILEIQQETQQLREDRERFTTALGEVQTAAGTLENSVTTDSETPPLERSDRVRGEAP